MADSQQAPQSVLSDDEIDLLAVLQSLWAGKWLIGGLTIASFVLALGVALWLPNVYRAEALLAPNEQDGASGLSALAAQYGGLAGLAGIDLSGKPANRTALAIKVLKSRKFISEFVQRHNILVPLMAVRGWNAASGELKIDPDLYDETSKSWVRESRPPRQSKPSMQEAYEAFDSILTVNEDSRTGFVVVAIEHYSPQLAKQWVDWLVEDINSTMMASDVAEAEQAIEYLNEQIAATSVADLQSVFFRLIEEQTKTVMLARMSPEYMFRTVDPAVTPELKSGPSRVLILFLGALLGGVLGVIAVLVSNGLAPAVDQED